MKDRLPTCCGLPMLAFKDKYTRYNHLAFVCRLCGLRRIIITETLKYNSNNDVYEFESDIEKIEDKGEKDDTKNDE